MRKKLDTRFPAARIKKIMQADEDVGKIAMAVPVLVSKALELFLQDLCDRTYDITVRRGQRLLTHCIYLGEEGKYELRIRFSRIGHRKHCVHSYNVFDFLKEVVSKVPDYGNSDAAAAADTPKRRKVDDEESKKSSMQEAPHASSSGSGRGRGRDGDVDVDGPAEQRREKTPRHEIESSSTTSQQNISQVSSPGRPMDNDPKLSESLMEDVKVIDGVGSDSKNFDLNAGVDEGSDKMASTAAAVTASTSSAAPSDEKVEEYPGLSEMDRMAIDPVHLAQLSSRLDEEEEDYDEEG